MLGQHYSKYSSAWKAAQWKRSPQMRKCRGRSKVWVLKSSPRTDAIPVQATKSMTQGRKKRQLIDGGSQGGGIAPSPILGTGKPLQIYAGVMCRTRFQGTKNTYKCMKKPEVQKQSITSRFYPGFGEIYRTSKAVFKKYRILSN